MKFSRSLLEWMPSGFLTWGSCLTFVAFFSIDRALAEDAGAPPTDSAKFDLYLLVGQSNMAGRGGLTDADRQPSDRVWVFNSANEWAHQGEPVHFDKPQAGVGLGFTFAKQMAAANPAVTIGLIPCAVGGTPISRWKPGGDLFVEAVERAKVAMKSGQLRGILWHQGESECGDASKAAQYGASLAEVLGGFRRELDAPNAPVVVGELGEYLYVRSNGKSPFAREVNAQIDSLPERIPYVAVVKSAGLTANADELHFNAESLKEFGIRYAAALQKLLIGNKK